MHTYKREIWISWTWAPMVPTNGPSITTCKGRDPIYCSCQRAARHFKTERTLEYSLGITRTSVLMLLSGTTITRLISSTMIYTGTTINLYSRLEGWDRIVKESRTLAVFILDHWFMGGEFWYGCFLRLQVSFFQVFIFEKSMIFVA